MIKLRHLERRYPLGKEKFFYVLRDINLDIAEGEFVSVMGPSGAGKSTLLHILGMHDHGWEGEYSLNDTAVHHLKPKERATLRNEQIGFVFQQYHLLDDLTVYENLEIPLSYRRYSKSERAAMVADMLDRFQIGLALPLTLAINGDEVDANMGLATGDRFSTAGLGDLRIEAKGQLKSFGDDDQLVLAGLVGGTAPTAKSNS